MFALVVVVVVWVKLYIYKSSCVFNVVRMWHVISTFRVYTIPLASIFNFNDTVEGLLYQRNFFRKIFPPRGCKFQVWVLSFVSLNWSKSLP